jgi:hypothetical protein
MPSPAPHHPHPNRRRRAETRAPLDGALRQRRTHRDPRHSAYRRLVEGASPSIATARARISSLEVHGVR